MDFEFKHDAYGQATAHFSMGHEVMGLWFSEELSGLTSSSRLLIEKIFNTIAQLEKGQIFEQIIDGHDLQLKLDRFEVEVSLRGYHDNEDEQEELDADMHFYDAEANAGCGLADFKQALFSWQSFLNKAA